jgi:translation initiation factor 1 (eIF-1/SUI1)
MHPCFSNLCIFICSAGDVPLIRIAVEKRAGDKLMTKISRLEKYKIDPNDVAKNLQLMKASSSTSMS